MGWTSILVAIRLPIERWISLIDLRRTGGIVLGLLGLGALGLPIAAWHALVVLLGGVGVGVTRQRWRRAARPARRSSR